MAENQKDRYIQYLAEQNQNLRLTSDAGAEMAAIYHSVIGTVSFMAVLSGTSSELFSKISFNHFGYQPMLNSKLIN